MGDARRRPSESVAGPGRFGEESPDEYSADNRRSVRCASITPRPGVSVVRAFTAFRPVHSKDAHAGLVRDLLGAKFALGRTHCPHTLESKITSIGPSGSAPSGRM